MAKKFLEFIRDLNPKRSRSPVSSEQNFKNIYLQCKWKEKSRKLNNPIEGEKEKRKRKGRVKRKVQNKAIVISLNI